MIDEMVRLFADHVAEYGYVIAFVASVLENSIFLGLIVPGDTVILLSGFFAGQGAMSYPVVLVLLIIGSAIGDNIGFVLGRRKGKEWLKRVGPRFGYGAAKIKRVELFWERHGEKAILIGDFVAYVRTFVPFFAGTSTLEQRRFFAWDLLAVTIHSIILLTLSYFFGEYWQTIRQAFGIFGVILFGIFLVLVYKFFYKKGGKEK
jgi:undecaprenyl-diphosphatase